MVKGWTVRDRLCVRERSEERAGINARWGLYLFCLFTLSPDPIRVSFSVSLPSSWQVRCVCGAEGKERKRWLKPDEVNTVLCSSITVNNAVQREKEEIQIA